MDMSALVAWGTPLIACAAVAVLGIRRTGTESRVSAGTALGKAVGVGVVFMFVQVFLHGSCVEAMLCASRGDGNMSYWFQSLLAFPIYWLIYYSTANSKK